MLFMIGRDVASADSDTSGFLPRNVQILLENYSYTIYNK